MLTTLQLIQFCGYERADSGLPVGDPPPPPPPPTTSEVTGADLFN
jgi:hypothetical protein